MSKETGLLGNRHWPPSQAERDELERLYFYRPTKPVMQLIDWPKTNNHILNRLIDHTYAVMLKHDYKQAAMLGAK